MNRNIVALEDDEIVVSREKYNKLYDKAMLFDLMYADVPDIRELVNMNVKEDRANEIHLNWQMLVRHLKEHINTSDFPPIIEQT